MKIAKNTVVTVHYKLSDAQGTLIEDGQEPMVYLHGGYENTLPKIEEALEGKVAGFDTTIQVEPEDAFGEYDADLVKVEERKNLPTPLEVGMQFEGTPDQFFSEYWHKKPLLIRQAMPDFTPLLSAKELFNIVSASKLE